MYRKTLFIFLVAFVSCNKDNSDPVKIIDNIAETRAYQNVPSLPVNWSKISERNGVVFANRSYSRNNLSYTDFVTIADLSAGATIKLLQESSGAASSSSPSPTFTKKPLSHNSGSNKIWFWTTFNTSNSFTMSNLQFFGYSPAQLSFPLKENNSIISCGFGNNESFAKRKIGINGSFITVADYTNTSNTYASVAANLINPTVLVGLHPNANKSPNSTIPRTYLAKSGTKIILYNSRGAKTSSIKSILMNEFGVLESEIIMFDGSGSTQLVNLGGQYINSSDSRLIPSVLEIRSY